MRISHLRLDNFRNYAALDLALSPGLTLLQGRNAQGKTNVLEGISLLASGSSYRAGSDREVIRWQAEPEERLARVSGMVAPGRLPGQSEETQPPFELEVVIANIPGLASKRILVNGVGKRVTDLLGRLTVVFFGPEELDLVVGSPSYRRRYLDEALSQIDRRYNHALNQYNRALQQRNQLLKQLRERAFQPDELLFWDEQMAEHGSTVLSTRARALMKIASLAATRHNLLAAGCGRLDIEYETKLFRGSGGWRRLAEVDIDAVREEYRRWLLKERERELAQAVSVVGPHRDDMILTLDGLSVEKYGSRGQQRTVSLALKLAELDFLERESGDSPVLLLDDVLSELDAERRARLTEVIITHEQVFLTTTEAPPLPAAKTYQVVEGTLTLD